MAKVAYVKCDRCGSTEGNHHFEEGTRNSHGTRSRYRDYRAYNDFDLCDVCFKDLSNFLQDHKHDPIDPEVNPIGAAVAQTTQANRGGIIGALARKL